MKKSVMWIIGIVVVIAVAGGAYALVRHNNDKNNMNNMNMSSSTNSSSSSSVGSSSASTMNANSVTIQNFAFTQSSITVKKGTKVTWTNKDNVTHTVNETDSQSGGPNSGDIAPGGTYSFTFNAVGTFNYHCAIHPSMLGAVIVTE